MRSWPSAPMLNSPARNANATASAAPMNGVDRASDAAIAVRAAEHAAQQRPVGLDRVLADEQDDDAADGEREQDRAERDERRLAAR